MTRKPALVFFVVLQFLLVFPIHAQQRQIEWDKVQIKPQKLSPNVYMLQATGVNAAIGNVGVFVGDDGLVMVDCEYFELGPKLEAALKTISEKPVRYVFNTHWHGDHTGGNAYFGKTATIIAQENARKKMEAGGKLFPPSPAIALPIITFSDQLSLHVGGGEMHAIHFAHGHTDTDSLVIFPGGSVVQTGDSFVNWEVPGFPAIDQDTDGSGGVQGEIALAEYIISNAPDDVKVIPGHGVLGSKNDLAKELAVLKDTRAAVRLGIDQGKSLDQLMQEKVLAKWEYLNESHHIQSDVYLGRLYKELTQGRAGTAASAR